MNRYLYYLLQWTWGLPQNLAGAVLWLFFHKNAHFSFYHAKVIRVNSIFSTSLGMFLFLGNGGTTYPEALEQAILAHEYGHSFQSLLFGPLYFLVVGIPSVIWARLPGFVRRRQLTGRSYYTVWPEKQANHLGKKHTGIIPPQ